MQKVPVESLGLFEQLDRTVIVFLKKKPSPHPDNLYISISAEDYEKKKADFEAAGCQALEVPLGMALDNVIQQPSFQNLVIGGLYMVDVFVSKEDLLPLKDLIDSFCIMYAAANNRIENIKAYDLMKSKTVYFIGNLFTDSPQPGDQISFEGLKRETEDGSYEAVKCFLTRESAEQYNAKNRPVTAANLEHLKRFWRKPLIIEPYRNYWIEFL
ncbi:hypothetical protein STRDD11_02703 [Streptococcus sp. DD11]|uniref:hypothetical protein n=1 Tax=Streptococcus sp. DD11 TaxID=1777879 RepID=UPI000795D03D|nr:hypothetical protein [Streptococcus sp. DD11]KXT77150.1 hypothetical protein STRDD11_02703 [Streptococcus sp. DD11]